MTATISRNADGSFSIYLVTGSETVMTKEVPSYEVGVAVLRSSGWRLTDDDETWVMIRTITEARNGPPTASSLNECSLLGVRAYRNQVNDLHFPQLEAYGFLLGIRLEETAGPGQVWWLFSFRLGFKQGDTGLYQLTEDYDPVLDLCTLGDFKVRGLGYYSTDILAKLSAVQFFEKQRERYGGPELYAAALRARILGSLYRKTPG